MDYIWCDTLLALGILFLFLLFYDIGVGMECKACGHGEQLINHSPCTSIFICLCLYFLSWSDKKYCSTFKQIFQIASSRFIDDVMAY
jgi:hypothetical protein